MSAAVGVVGRILASLGGAPTAAVLVVGGVTLGAVGGGAIAAGMLAGGTATTTGELAVYPCPDTGPALYTVPAGQMFLTTGRTEDDDWLRIHNPLPGRTEAWIEADAVKLQGSLADLPVAVCAPELKPISAVWSAKPSLTAVEDNSPSPEPTPAPTPTPNAKPSLASLRASTGKISYDTGSYCPKAVKKVTFRVKAGDAAGIQDVALFWRRPGAATYASTAMTRTAGTSTGGTWSATLSTAADGITQAGKLAYYIVATDVGGATRRIPAKGAESLRVAVCENTGPTIKSAASSSGSSLSWDPLGVGGCRTRTTISAAVTDIDGVKSVTLSFRRPGDAAWSSKPMAKRSGKWSASLDTLSDKITIPDPPTDSLRWYIKAVDDKGATSQTKSASITVRRCDSEARFFVNSITTEYRTCPAKLSWSFSVSDPDGVGDAVSKATLSYRIVNNATGATSSGTSSVTVTSQRFSMASEALQGKTFFGSNTVTWTVTTTDRYGGKSSADGKATVMIGC